MGVSRITSKPTLYEEQRETASGRWIHYYVEKDISTENYDKFFYLTNPGTIKDTAQWDIINDIPGIHRADFLDNKEAVAKDCDVSLDDYLQNE